MFKNGLVVRFEFFKGYYPCWLAVSWGLCFQGVLRFEINQVVSWTYRPYQLITHLVTHTMLRHYSACSHTLFLASRHLAPGTLH